MKKIIIPLAMVMLATSVVGGVMAPQRDKDKRPIVVDKMCYAEELGENFHDEIKNLQDFGKENLSMATVVEYEDDGEENQEECEDCVSICVRGQSVLSVVPDKATIYAVIENMDTDMVKSKDANFSVFDGVINALKKAGADDEQICMQHFNCMPSYDYSNGRTLQGYMTTTSFSVKIENIENIKTLVDVMTENGVTTICNIQYEVSTLEEEYSNALSSAYENARAKAVKLLGEENLKLKSIREEMVFASNNLYRSYVEGVSSSLIGKIDIEAHVFAEFEKESDAKSV